MKLQNASRSPARSAPMQAPVNAPPRTGLRLMTSSDRMSSPHLYISRCRSGRKIQYYYSSVKKRGLPRKPRKKTSPRLAKRKPYGVGHHCRAFERDQDDDHLELFRHVASFRSDSTRMRDFGNNKTALAGGFVRSRFTIPPRAESGLLPADACGRLPAPLFSDSPARCS